MIDKYIAHIKDNPEGYWFKRKMYGIGWVPARPQGWAVIALYVVTNIIMLQYVDADSHSGSDTIIGLMPFFILSTVVLTLICLLKGERLRFSWGDKTNEKNKK